MASRAQLVILNNIDDLRTLRALYMAKGLTQMLGYQTLDNYINWFERKAHQEHIKVYTLPEAWRRSGLYLIVDRYQLMVNALDTEDAAEELKIALPQLDWSRGYKMTGVPALHYETVLKILADMRLHIDTIRLIVVHIPREQILNLDVSTLPPEYEFRPLTIADAALVDNIWYSHGNGTLEFIKRLITYNCNIGISLKSTGELIAWCIRCNLGLLGMLHVKEAYRGRGLARSIVHQVSRQIAVAGGDVGTMISDRNSASLALFNKLNFKEIGVTYIIRTKRSENSEIWSDEQEAKED
ncbi:uncharacterized protein LOC129249157 [Anastrepha obliqua]|uniref:uncharacterized protein LOC129249157 n=1 Tax=Anastrepha obliqua TaxID=95512 RepID=UPI0024099B4A|nr:uncharacterized protein LOC129249157 [Anastrepha obliqua]